MVEEITPTFGELLREHRLAIGLTQEALAERAGVSTRGIQALERGESKPQRDTARRLASALTLAEGERARFLAAATPAPRRRAVPSAAAPEGTLSPALAPLPTGMLTFLIADVRGYTAYTHEHGDEAGARLAVRFAALAGEAVTGQEGRVVEVRGDEVLAVFTSARKALRAAADLPARCDAAPDFPLRAGVGLDVGEPATVPGGYRGEAINVAARLCSQAGPGEILASDGTVHLARHIEGLAFEDRGQFELKGIAHPVRVWSVQVGVADTGAFSIPAPASRRPAPRHNLPAALSSFIGREQEQAEILELLARDRLVTLVGPGGVGKTRLALAVAAQALDRHPDGVWLVELAGLASTTHGGASLLPEAVAGALGLREEPGRSLLDTLASHLHARSFLLVLDNCEHLVDACAALVGALLRAAPALRVLATSREGLGVRGEATYRLLPLALPPDLPGPAPFSPDEYQHYEAVRLFTERARARLHTFVLAAGNLGAVVALCRGLDGLPLALELAAARVGTLTVEGIVARLDDRFRLLAAGDRDLPPHQRTLRTTLQWSYDLLRPEERTLFRRLAVFAGWTLEAAEAITALAIPGDPAPPAPGDVLDLLGELVNKSLVTAETPPATAEHGEPRFRLLETVGAFAAECLAAGGEGEAIRAAHADWYTALAERAAPELRGALQAGWLARLDADGENLRAALAWARDNGRIERGLRLAAALWRYWYVRGRLREGRFWLDSLLETARDDATVSPVLHAAALQGASSLAEAAGAYERAAALARRGLELYRAAGEREGEGAALNTLGNVAREQGDLAAAERWFEESLALGRASGDPRGAARALNNLATVRRLRGDLDDAESLALQSLVLRREQDDRGGMAGALDNLAAIDLAHGDIAAARAHCDEALALWREVGDTWGIATGLATQSAAALGAGEHEAAERLAGESLVLWEALEDRRSAARVRNTRGILARLRGDLDLAAALHRESLRASAGLGDPYGQVHALEGLATLAATSDPEHAATLFGAAAARRASLGMPLSPGDGPTREAVLRSVRERLGEERFAAAWALGEALPADQVVELGLR